ncbi:(d)CMP kinase [Candidatus Babeliales bacterium]|nr:(d)CMP kinase [Candidatus Babeliales bacterium]
MIITIDGPSGSGKTTLAVMLAKHLNFFCLNSGYLYRGLAYILRDFYNYDFAKIQNPDLHDIQAIFDSGNFVYVYEQGLIKVFWIDNITLFLKDPEISKMAAMLAQHDGARGILRIYERLLVQDKDTVVEGRACGSVIYPQAEVKLYVDATPELRAHRFQRDQLKRGRILTHDEALQQIRHRDEMDMKRPMEPLVIPQGAIVLDSAQLSVEELFQSALNAIKHVLREQSVGNQNV